MEKRLLSIEEKTVRKAANALASMHLRFLEGRLSCDEERQAYIGSDHQTEEGGEKKAVKMCAPDRSVPFPLQQGRIEAHKNSRRNCSWCLNNFGPTGPALYIVEGADCGLSSLSFFFLLLENPD